MLDAQCSDLSFRHLFLPRALLRRHWRGLVLQCLFQLLLELLVLLLQYRDILHVRLLQSLNFELHLRDLILQLRDELLLVSISRSVVTRRRLSHSKLLVLRLQVIDLLLLGLDLFFKLKLSTL